MTKNAAVKGIWNKYAYIKQKNDYLGIENTFSKGKKTRKEKSTKDYDEKLQKWGKEAIF